MAKKKRMTVREKDARRAARKRLQEQGILMPDKPKLNRKNFVDEAKDEWNNKPNGTVWELYLMHAFSWIITKTEARSSRLSLEAVGAAKILKIAIRLREFSEKVEGEGRKEYTLAEEYDYIKDILDA